MPLDHGHEVLLSPPYYSDIQPIEKIWDNMKGTVSQQYTTLTTIKDVLERMNDAFDNLISKIIEGCIIN